jgi:aminoglycoside phosphotransferase (APT) family kinase protein
LRRLRGGVSAAVHLITVIDRRGRERRVVLRRFVRPDWQRPALAAREANALRAVVRSAVPAPELIAFDAGERCDVPAVLVTALPGRAVLDPREFEPWLRQLAEQLPLIHETDASAFPIPPYRPYTDPRTVEVPGWTRERRAWRNAVELARGRRPPVRRRFIHRDYHPGNVLWLRGRLSGIVDWPSASIGPPQIDVAHCRVNLVRRHGLDVADRFLALHQSLIGRSVGDYDPYWDALGLADTTSSGSIGLPDWASHERTEPPDREVRGRLDGFARAVAGRIGGA